MNLVRSTEMDPSRQNLGVEESPSYIVSYASPTALFDYNDKADDYYFNLKEKKQPLFTVPAGPDINKNASGVSASSSKPKEVKTKDVQVSPDDLGIEIGKNPAFPAIEAPRAFDPNFIGPVKIRRCTDPIVLGIFLACLIAWFAIAGYAVSSGDIKRLMYPTDSMGFVCGMEMMENLPFLFYFDLTQCVGVAALITGCLTTAICVPMCPNSSFSFMEFSKSPDDIDPSRLICSYEVNKTKIRDFRDVTALVTSQQCAAYYFPSGAIGGRCFPGLGMYNNGTFFNIFDTKIPRGPPIFSPVNSTISTTTASTTPTTPKTTTTTTTTSTTSTATTTSTTTTTTVAAEAARVVNVTGLDNKTITPDAARNGSQWLMEYMKTEALFANIAKDLAGTSWIILLFYFVGALFCFIWVLAIRWLALWLVWFAMATISGLLLYGVYYCFSMYTLIMDAFSKNNGTSAAGFTNYLDLTMYLTSQDFWLTLGLLLLGMIVLLLFLTWAIRTRIRTAVSLMKEASKAVSAIKSTFLFPIIPFIVETGLLALGIYVSLNLMSTQRLTGIVTSSNDDATAGFRVNDTCDPNTFKGDLREHPKIVADCQMQKLGVSAGLIVLQIYNITMIFWSIFFTMSLCDLVLSGTFATYYWTWDKAHNIPKWVLRDSLWRTSRYHLGSVAFGALLVTICRVIRVVFDFVGRFFKRLSSQTAAYVLRFFSCCVFIFEAFIKFINRNAYIMIAIYGKGFYPSAKAAFFLVTRNTLRVLAINSVTSFLLFLGKLTIVGVHGATSFYIFSGWVPGMDPIEPPINYTWLPTILVCLGTYFIANEIFQVFETAVDTMFICFLEDLEQNDGTPERPYLMPARLIEILTPRVKKEIKPNRPGVPLSSGDKDAYRIPTMEDPRTRYRTEKKSFLE